MKTRLMLALAEEALLAKFRRYCSFNGIELLTVRDGVQCWTELHRFSPAALVLDFELPWGGGDGVLELMREDARLATIPVVMLCDWHNANSVSRRPPNVVGYLIKPADVETLFEIALSAADYGELVSRSAGTRMECQPAMSAQAGSGSTSRTGASAGPAVSRWWVASSESPLQRSAPA